jgi:hypothetical protein
MRRLPNVPPSSPPTSTDQRAQGVERRPNANEDENDGEHPLAVGERANLFEADGRDRRHGLVEGVEQAEPEDEIADRACGHDADQGDETAPQPPPVDHRAGRYLPTTRPAPFTSSPPPSRAPSALG